MWKTYKEKNIPYSLRRSISLLIPNLNTQKYGINSLTLRGSVLWNSLPIKLKKCLFLQELCIHKAKWKLAVHLLSVLKHKEFWLSVVLFSSMMTVTIKVNSTLQSMKQSKLHLSFLIVLTEGECVNSLSTLFRMEGGGSAKRFPASFPQHFWLLALITFPHSCKILGSYLVLILNYWTWTKTTAQKNR